MTRMLYTVFIMNAQTKKYIWTAAAGVATYLMALAQMIHDLHPATAAQNFVAVFLFPLCPAVFVCTVINLKSMTPQKKKYFSRFCAGMGAYVLGIDVANHIHAPSSPYKYMLILLPVLPLIYVCFITIRYIADSDELWRKFYLEACAFSGIATGFTCFSYLFVHDLGAPAFHAEWAFYIMWIYYFIGLSFSWRRYK